MVIQHAHVPRAVLFQQKKATWSVKFGRYRLDNMPIAPSKMDARPYESLHFEAFDLPFLFLEILVLVAPVTLLHCRS
jgi:hypothetical protein